ncbi:hypothetical protein [Gaetbulibacter saemankumensis]|uniref:hypothetical protein n=1 Tax=Gaetbulibacter saemankumensis TaxID=311208 RepID=UPI00040C2E94|nr:hypothetical protein [Gaetbulibacter saemankumensis]
MKLKKIIRISLGLFIFLTLPSILFFSFVYFKYNEDLPKGIEGKQADSLAHAMLVALNHEAYQNTNTIEWSFKKRRHYKWDKKNNMCDVYWKEYKVTLDLNNHTYSKAYIHSFNVDSKAGEDLKTKALDYFKNDSFWLVAPYQVFDKNTLRQVVELENNNLGLLVTYLKEQDETNDSYLWFFDDDGKPKAFKMWTSQLPFNGLTASWNDWETTETGAILPTFHKLFILGLEIDYLKTEF